MKEACAYKKAFTVLDIIDMYFKMGITSVRVIIQMHMESNLL